MMMQSFRQVKVISADGQKAFEDALNAFLMTLPLHEPVEIRYYERQDSFLMAFVQFRVHNVVPDAAAEK